MQSRQYRKHSGECQLGDVLMVYRSMLGWLFPTRCLICAHSSASGLCEGCRQRLAWMGPACRRCGLAIPVRACPARGTGWALDSVLTPLRFAAPVVPLLHAAKFAARRDIARALGEILADTLATRAARVDAAVAMPLHSSRWRARGYNQAVEIARPVARRLGLPLWIAGIERVRSTVPQAGLGAAARRGNLQGAFRVSRRLPACRLAVIDDVLTTGATANALAACLRAAGAVEVHAWAVARVHAPG
jgi:ComF family protein